MGAITVAHDLQQVLARLNEKTELRDASGNTIGIFTPTNVAESELYRRARAQVDPELIKKRKQETGSLTFDELKQRIEALESAE